MATKKNDLVERTIRIKSAAGPVHVIRGFIDDGQGDIVIAGLPEDEFGHWAPYYRLTVNGQELEPPEVVSDGT